MSIFVHHVEKEYQVWVPENIDKVFDFFSNARNLEKITPPFLEFKVLNKGKIKMKEGLLIDYRLRLHKIPFKWQSEITKWEPRLLFEDCQRKGPYVYWDHLHSFEKENGGTLVTDSIKFGVPGGFLVYKTFVERDVEKIFDFRKKILQEIFN
tara:strand:+ start:877 stop:1332 length:456 start_codon:yes stop_codon:yes gene_type:complete